VCKHVTNIWIHYGSGTLGLGLVGLGWQWARGFLWIDVMVAILKVWRRSRDLTHQSMYTHSRNSRANYHPDWIWSDGALGFLEEVAPTVPLIRFRPWRYINLFTYLLTWSRSIRTRWVVIWYQCWSKNVPLVHILWLFFNDANMHYSVYISRCVDTVNQFMQQCTLYIWQHSSDLVKSVPSSS